MQAASMEPLLLQSIIPKGQCGVAVLLPMELLQKHVLSTARDSSDPVYKMQTRRF